MYHKDKLNFTINHLNRYNFNFICFMFQFFYSYYLLMYKRIHIFHFFSTLKLIDNNYNI